MKKSFNLILIILFLQANITNAQITNADEKMNEYLPLIKNKKVGITANHTSYINGVHIVDTLLSEGIQIKAIFAPEHGFKGEASAGTSIKDGKYKNIPVYSLYGNNKKPEPDQLKGLDVMLFDIQDVGVRFYTYISTMTYLMESCAENNIAMIVLDRPNPNGHYVDGPVLKKEFKSFVGLHEIPVVYGMTIGEYALMVNGEKWLKNNIQCKLKVIKLSGYNREDQVLLEIPPSPNLQTPEAISLYPSLCLFEGTDVSVGRGTQNPFEVIGKPDFSKGNYSFTPSSIKGVSENPLHEGKECNGYFLKDYCQQNNCNQLNLKWLIEFYNFSSDKSKFFNSFFDKLAGTDILKSQIIEGKSEYEIRNSWENDIVKFLRIREKYLLYQDKFMIYEPQK